MPLRRSMQARFILQSTVYLFYAVSQKNQDTTFKVKSQGHQAALFSAALTRKAAAAVSVGTYSAWATERDGLA